MSLYPTPVSVAQLKAYMRLADNTSGIDNLLTDCLETATERVYSFCNWDWTRKLTAHPDPTIATYDQYNRRWIKFIGDGKNTKRVGFSVGLVRQMTRYNPFTTEDPVSYQIGSAGGMVVPSTIIYVAGEQRNVLCGVDGFIFEKGYEYEMELIYQNQDDSLNRNYTIPDTILMAITHHAEKLFNDSGYGSHSLGQSEITGAFGFRMKLTDLDADIKVMLHPFRYLPI